MKLNRRSFLTMASAALSGGTQIIAAESIGQPVQENPFTITAFASDGAGRILPATQDHANNMYLMDLSFDPIRRDIKLIGEGKFSAVAPNKSFAIAALLHVPTFGNAWIYTDNNGRGYRIESSGRHIFLNYELASSRIAAAKKYITEGKSEGCTFSSQSHQQLSEATAILAQAASLRTKQPEQAAKLAFDALSKVMWASERIALERARHRISHIGPRPDFLFGCNAFKYNNPDGKYETHFREIFNFATLPFYWRSFEPNQGSPNWPKLDRMTSLLNQVNITPKGHPLIWLHEAGVPSWLEDKAFETFHHLSKQRIHDIVTRYRDTIRIWDVINEAHDFANILDYSQDQLRELTRMASKTTKSANPKAIRIINNTLMWGEYTLKPGDSTRTKWTPRTYIADLIKSGISFDVIGIQMYYADHDIFETDRLYERFGRFRKPVHITEIGVSSAPTEDPTSHAKHPPGLWHAPWSESIQADYLEQFYTIAYSKPFIKAITYWDFSDEGGHVWPHGGLLGPEDKPKESFYRLKALIESWRSM